MREVLKELMRRAGDTPTTLSRRTGVPQPTIYRFVEAKVRDMKSENAEKIAIKGYGITESQLRGDIFIEWLDIDIRKTTQHDTAEDMDFVKILKKYGITKENLTFASADRLSEFLKSTPEQQDKALTVIRDEKTKHGQEKGNGNESK